jgi:hypothetical protein
MKKQTLIFGILFLFTLNLFAQKEHERVFFNLYDMEARFLEKQYNIPYVVSMSIAAKMSDFGRGDVYKAKNNPFGLKDENGKYKKYRNQQKAWIDFAETLRKKNIIFSQYRSDLISIKEVLYQDCRPEWAGEVIRLILEHKARFY